jgi:hypothetical protein
MSRAAADRDRLPGRAAQLLGGGEGPGHVVLEGAQSAEARVGVRPLVADGDAQQQAPAAVEQLLEPSNEGVELGPSPLRHTEVGIRKAQEERRGPAQLAQELALARGEPCVDVARQPGGELVLGRSARKLGPGAGFDGIPKRSDHPEAGVVSRVRALLAELEPLAERLHQRRAAHHLAALRAGLGPGDPLDRLPCDQVQALAGRVADHRAVGRPGLDPDLHPERRQKIQRGELAHGRLECQGRGHAAAAIVGVEPGHEAVAAEVQHAAAETVDLSDQAVVDAVQGDDELLGAAAQTEAAH